ncbi:MAG: hypothetical protein WBN20_14360, partial [Eudoraea sp.]|uniref:hypothetical protein n=1 Tax=Eudoraea sp. TaxID=1979955 RepID=UPI003C72119F
GLEHRLDRAGVVGSNPIHSTSSRKSTQVRVDFLYLLNRKLVPEFGMYKISMPVKTGFDFLFAAADFIWISELIELIQYTPQIDIVTSTFK